MIVRKPDQYCLFPVGVTTPGVTAPAVVPVMPLLVSQGQQAGPIIQGPGAKREEKTVLASKLNGYQQDLVNRAKKFAMEQNIKNVLVKQTIAHQHTVSASASCLYLFVVIFVLKKDDPRYAVFLCHSQSCMLLTEAHKIKLDTAATSSCIGILCYLIFYAQID